MSDTDKNHNSNQKKRQQNKKKGGGNRNNSKAQKKKNSSQGSSQNRRSRGGGDRGKRKRRSGPKLSPAERVVKKYENLLEQHASARRKYFDLFNLADPQQKEKLEKNFYKTLEDVRKFEDSLEGVEREVFLERFYYDGEVDRTYSKNREISPQGEHAPEGPFEDPHLLEDQKASDYSDDDEETCGSMDDYHAYKDQLT